MTLDECRAKNEEGERFYNLEVLEGPIFHDWRYLRVWVEYDLEPYDPKCYWYARIYYIFIFFGRH